MKPYTGCIIQARLNSTRFPKKILADFFGKSVLETVVERCYESKLVDKVVIASPHHLGVCLNEELFIGSESDVLDRYYQCATKYNFDLVVRITADCVLIPPDEIDRCIERILERDTHYVTNIGSLGRFGLPDGYDVEVFSYKALKESWERKIPDEHCTTWIKQNADYNPIFLEPIKLSIDTEDDLKRIKEYVTNRKKDITYRRHGQFCSELPKSTTYAST